MSSRMTNNKSESQNIDLSAFENTAKSLIESSIVKAEDRVASMKKESESSVEDSYFACPIHGEDEDDSGHDCHCSKLKVLREKAVSQVEVYKREKSRIQSIRLSIDEEEARKSSLKEALEKLEEIASPSIQSVEFVECSESCISHKKPHMCTLKKKKPQAEEKKLSDSSTHTMTESREADDEDSVLAANSPPLTTRKSSKKSQTRYDDDENAPLSRTATVKSIKDDAPNSQRGSTIANITVETAAEDDQVIEVEPRQSIRKSRETEKAKTLSLRSRATASTDSDSESDVIERRTSVKSKEKSRAATVADDHDDDRAVPQAKQKSAKQSAIKSRNATEVPSYHENREASIGQKSAKQSRTATNAPSSDDEKPKDVSRTQSSRKTSTKSKAPAESDDESSDEPAHYSSQKQRATSSKHGSEIHTQTSRAASVKSKKESDANLAEEQLTRKTSSKLRPKTVEIESDKSGDDSKHPSRRSSKYDAEPEVVAISSRPISVKSKQEIDKYSSGKTSLKSKAKAESDESSDEPAHQTSLKSRSKIAEIEADELSLKSKQPSASSSFKKSTASQHASKIQAHSSHATSLKTMHESEEDSVKQQSPRHTASSSRPKTSEMQEPADESRQQSRRSSLKIRAETEFDAALESESDDDKKVSTYSARQASVKSKAKTLASEAASLRATAAIGSQTDGHIDEEVEDTKSRKSSQKSRARTDASARKTSAKSINELVSIEDLEVAKFHDEARKSSKGLPKISIGEQPSQRETSHDSKGASTVRFSDSTIGEAESESKRSSLRSRPPTPIPDKASREASLRASKESDDDELIAAQLVGKSLRSTSAKSANISSDSETEGIGIMNRSYRASSNFRPITAATERVISSDDEIETISRQTSVKSRPRTEVEEKSARQTSVKSKAATVVLSDNESSDEIETVSRQASQKSRPRTEVEEKSARQTSVKSKAATVVFNNESSDESEPRASVTSRAKTAASEIESKPSMRSRMIKEESQESHAASRIHAVDSHSDLAAVLSKAASMKAKSLEKSRVASETQSRSTRVIDSDDELLEDSHPSTIRHTSLRTQMTDLDDDTSEEDVRAMSEKKNETVKEEDEEKPAHICTCALKYPELFRQLKKQ